MKKLVSLLLTLCLCLSVGGFCSACGDVPPGEPVDYTVTENEWKVNFNLTAGSTQAQILTSAPAQAPALLASEPLTQITSYTIYAEGNSGGNTGTSLLKVAPNALSIDFTLNDVKEDESGTYASSDVLYQGLTKSIMSYFPFANYYNDFTFDQAKNAYTCSNLTSITYDEYDPTDINYVYTKTAEVQFVNGYLKTVTVVLCDENFAVDFASFVFTFSNINSTTVTL